MRFCIPALAACAALACSSKTPAPPPPPPAAPSGLTVVTNDTTATLQWTASAGAVDYAVTRGTTAVGTTAMTSLSDSGLTPNTSYVYSVHARNASGGNSSDATVTAVTAPPAPASVSASGSNHHVTLTWTAAAGAGSAGYRVLRSLSASGPFVSIGATTGTSYTDTFLTNNTSYSYVVHSIGGSGESADSNGAAATPVIEVCALDASANTVSAFDGTASGNITAKRSFGWRTGIADGTGIGIDGSNLFIASKQTRTINVYSRTVNGNVGPSAVINLPGLATALTVDSTNHEVYAAVQAVNGFTVYVYSTTGSFTQARSLFVGSGGYGVHGLGLDLTHDQLFVLSTNQILVYARTASDATSTTHTTITPAAPVTSNTILYGGVYDSFDDAIWVTYDGKDSIGNPAGYAASYSRMTGSTVHAPFTSTSTLFPLPNAHGIWLQSVTSTNSFIWVASASVGPAHLGDAIYQFTRTGGSLNNVIRGSNTGLYQPGAMALDTVNSEFWVLNGRDGAEAFTSSYTTSNAFPQRSLNGVSTGLLDPVALAVDRANRELVELDFGPVQSINAYSLTSSGGAVTAARTITGPTTTLSAGTELAISVDEAGGKYWVSEDQPALVAFDRTLTGDGAPLQAISGTNMNQYSPFHGLAWDPKGGQIVGGFQSASVAGQNDLVAWPGSANGNMAPAADGTVSSALIGQLTSLSIDFVHDLIFTSDNTGVSAFSRTFASGAISPAVSFSAPAHQVAVDAEGDEVYVTQGNDVEVYPRASSGTPAATRTIKGAATGLYNVVSLIVCN